jgi:hypothetical protein
VTMTAAMVAALGILTEALDEPGTDIAHSLQQLALAAAAAIPTYHGLSVVVPLSDPPFALTTLADGVKAGDIRTSLQVLLPIMGAGHDAAAVAVILYASVPGTFVDLAADLAWLTGRPISEVTLDGHLSVPAAADISVQLHAASAINQAIGVLIGRGCTPDQAHRHLDTQAATNRTDRHAAAQLILGTVTDTVDERDRDIH